MFWMITTGILFVCIGVLGFYLYRTVTRLIAYDDLFQLLADDVQTNLRQFEKMQSGVMMSNEPEVMEAHKNMMIMAKRLNEFINRMEELTGLKLRPPPRPPRPTFL
jgi:hypothetical protein